MDTTKILAFRHASQLELLLESLVAALNVLSMRARRVKDRSELPAVLQKIVIRATKARLSWAAWAQNGTLLLFTAEQPTVHPREPRRTALVLNVYNERGNVRHRGLWVHLRHGKWQHEAMH